MFDISSNRICALKLQYIICDQEVVSSLIFKYRTTKKGKIVVCVYKIKPRIQSIGPQAKKMIHPNSSSNPLISGFS